VVRSLPLYNKFKLYKGFLGLEDPHYRMCRYEHLQTTYTCSSSYIRDLNNRKSQVCTMIVTAVRFLAGAKIFHIL